MGDRKTESTQPIHGRIFKNQLVIFALVLAISACTATATPNMSVDTPAVSSTSTPEVTSTPEATPIPPGTEGNPIVMGIIYTSPAEQAPAAEELIQYLADQTGWVFAIKTYNTSMDLLTDMDKGNVSFAWLHPEEYLYASEMNIASVALLTSHYGLYGYGSNVYIPGDSGFSLYFDEDTGTSTRDASASLRQFAQKTPCLVSTGSLSGYAYPLGLLAEQEININTPVLLQTHEAVIRAVAAGGICDFGVTYGILGDPRTASDIQADISDVMEKVKIAWQSPPDIPTLNLSYGVLLSGDLRYAISNALVEYAGRADGAQKLTQMTGYSIDGIRPASNDEYDSLRGALQAAAIDSLSLISK